MEVGGAARHESHHVSLEHVTRHWRRGETRRRDVGSWVLHCHRHAVGMSVPVPGARPLAERGITKLDTVLFHFFAKTVAVAADSRLLAAEARRTNKWVCTTTAFVLTQFSLEIAEVEQYFDALRPWRALSVSAAPPPLMVEVCLCTSALDDALEVRASTPSGPVVLGHGATMPIVLERWCLDLRPQDTPQADRLPAVYKQAIVHFRALYSLARTLPVYTLCRRLHTAAKDANMGVQLAPDVRVRAAPGGRVAPLALPTDVRRLAPVSTPVGELVCTVEYTAVSDVAVVPRGADLPERSALASDEAPLRAPTHPEQGMSPLARAMRMPALQRRDSGADRPAPPARAVPMRSEMTLALPSDAASPRGRTAYETPRALAPASLTLYEPGALRTLFSTSPRTGASPSSLAMHTPPPVGSFDAAMRRQADASPGQGARPQRIERYSRQPSYRRRAGSSAGEDAAPVRSWSQRREERRALERAAALDAATAVHAPSPSTSPRVFTGATGPAPVFALAKPPRTTPAVIPPAPPARARTSSLSGHARGASLGVLPGTSFGAHASPLGSPLGTPAGDSLGVPPEPGPRGDEALDLVHMIDARRGLATAPSPARRRSSGATATPNYYDDVLAKMAESLQLYVQQEPPWTARGGEVRDEVDDEAAGRLELSMQENV